MLSEDGKLPSEVEQAQEANQQEDSNTTEISESTSSEAIQEESPKEDDHIEAIEESNAEDAEDHHNEERHRIPLLDYHSMSLENLVGEFQRLVKNEKI